jgi:hypothetical protein
MSTIAEVRRIVNNCVVDVAWYRNGKRMTGKVRGLGAIFERAGVPWLRVVDANGISHQVRVGSLATPLDPAWREP